MIDFDQFSRIKNYHEQRGLNATQIAGELGLDPRTVAYWLSQKRFRPRNPVHRKSKLDPFKSSIIKMLEAELPMAYHIPRSGLTRRGFLIVS